MTSEQMPETERRRVVDEQFAAIQKKFSAIEGNMALQADATLGLQTDVTELKKNLKENTDATKASAETITEVKNILTTFKTLGTFARWASSIGAAILGLFAAWKGLSK